MLLHVPTPSCVRLTAGGALAFAAALALAASGCGSDDSTDGGGDGDQQPATIPEARSDKSHDTTPDVTDAEYASFVAANTDFGFELFRAAAPGEVTNAVLSPTSVSVALAMAYAGAEGDTAAQMAGALRYELPAESLHAAFNRLKLELASLEVAPYTSARFEGEKSVSLRLVSSAWGQQGYGFVPSYLDTLSTEYDAGVKLVDFVGAAEPARLTINQWVSDQTNSKIDELLPMGSVDALTRLVLVNALYFKGSWANEFSARATSDAPFHAPGGDVTVPTMRDTSHIPYVAGEDYELAELPYDGGQLSMTLIVPAEGSFGAIRDALSHEWLDAATEAAAANDESVMVALPKFELRWGTESLKSVLEGLGMVDAFSDDAADFSGMEAGEDPLHVADVMHQAYVAVDESGTEAAAATAVAMAGTVSVPPPPIPFEVDRPFIFLIRTADGTVLFVGQITDPS